VWAFKSRGSWEVSVSEWNNWGKGRVQNRDIGSTWEKAIGKSKLAVDSRVRTISTIHLTKGIMTLDQLTKYKISEGEYCNRKSRKVTTILYLQGDNAPKPITGLSIFGGLSQRLEGWVP
jgi:hypothetical protein